jgi:hypothetical protein
MTTIPPRTPDEHVLHVYPVNDLRDHDTASHGACWCRPAIEEEGTGYIVTHNSLDGRERFETGERRPS